MTIVSRPYDKNGEDTYDRVYGKKKEETLEILCLRCTNRVNCFSALKYSRKFETCGDLNAKS